MKYEALLALMLCLLSRSLVALPQQVQSNQANVQTPLNENSKKTQTATPYEAPEEAIAAVASVRDRPKLADKIPSVAPQFYTKAKRFEFQTGVGFGLNNPFYQLYLLHFQTDHYFLESLSLGLLADYVFAEKTSVQPAAVPKILGVANQPFDYPEYFLRGQLAWAPIYGKINLFGLLASRFDIYFATSIGCVGSARSHSVKPSFGFALGQHYFIQRSLALRLEIREELYKNVRVPPNHTPERLENLLSFNLGLSFYLPTLLKKFL